MAKREKRVIITLTDEEFLQCQLLAKSEDRNVGPWFRWLGLERVKNEVPERGVGVGVRDAQA